MKSNDHSWKPTLTMAKLFEEQNQFYEALAAYELISQNDSSPEIREKIEELHLHLLNDSNSVYDPRIEQLFSPEELSYLKIIHHQGYCNMVQAKDKLEECVQGSELIFNQVMPEDFLADEAEVESLTEILNEIEQQAQLNLISENNEFGEYNVQDLLIAILAKFDKNQKLSEVKLSDLVTLFLEMQSLKIKT